MLEPRVAYFSWLLVAVCVSDFVPISAHRENLAATLAHGEIIVPLLFKILGVLFGQFKHLLVKLEFLFLLQMLLLPEDLRSGFSDILGFLGLLPQLFQAKARRRYLWLLRTHIWPHRNWRFFPFVIIRLLNLKEA